MPHTGPELRISLSALAANYRLLAKTAAGAECAAVVKADGYGLGALYVSQALAKAGCKAFFVATLEEALLLSSSLGLTQGSHASSGAKRSSQVKPENGIRIIVFHGPYPNEESEYLAHGIVPVLNHSDQLRRWLAAAPDAPFVLHADTGMTRLGFSHGELKMALERYPDLQTRTDCLLMSHLACAGTPEHPKNAEQLQRFRAARALLPGWRASLANSSGIFLKPDFHFDLTRPGCALYGITPNASRENPMQPVASLSAPILQIRALEKQETIGYDATATAPAGARLATVQLGYADGLLRVLSDRAPCFVAGYKTRILGRVSMDMVVADVSNIPESELMPGTAVEFLNADYTVNDMARDAGTIGYEIFTRMGSRIQRVYID